MLKNSNFVKILFLFSFLFQITTLKFIWGIEDISRPDWGDPAPMETGKIPVFWACGVTPQAAVEQANLPFCITHKPGHMLITEIPENAEVPVFTKST